MYVLSLNVFVVVAKENRIRQKLRKIFIFNMTEQRVSMLLFNL